LTPVVLDEGGTHTAEETRRNTGPDGMFSWNYMNTLSVLRIIMVILREENMLLLEESLANGE
jgi:hypothetical protein